MDDFSHLPPEQLETLADLLETGRLPMPRPGSDALAELGRAGFTAAQTAILLRAVAAASRARAAAIDLVASGPDSAATARDTAIVVEELFRGATRSVLVVGFALHDGPRVFAALAERMDADTDLEVTCCLDVSRPMGDTSRDDEIASRFADRFRRQEWPGRRLPRVFYDPRALQPHAPGVPRAVLHAKTIVVDDVRALVTSANLTSAGQERNVELGLLVRSPSIATAIRAHFDRLIAHGILVRLPL